ncbi:similar to Saccharomyces cerevisiae YHR061C GIC1 Protein of unknown function involved in initiation of budding and cellular polarization [Maudiozyma barnettii]|uniref:CRIB domain-containing protein n=1 Tax=Maudiozyma barnettii TaxID=61262 RepID=A0A8H2VBT1_9SACH|nr:Gic1p [Kazachstania barnettii]CAB4252363.1 similar to Saccharomyces cerevisiae YHR061C GIC1 Protein of unknown function involved in initiation of budding and cellular polarization [Kazachstania barnettii]CAD1779097.1 similar to Saccharomyces cerevisiae YHR061C GIC1 Protein of unknown function involved in initiation of budding and cellular polarization [Kazachstania barnettii]
MSVNVLPQMKSIWIDEDQEAEKLYGIQAQQLMDSGSDYDDEDGEYHGIPDLMLINSDKPILNNKKNIELSGLKNASSPTKYQSHATEKSSTNKKSSSSKKFFKKLFNSSSFKQESSMKKRNISTPYHFQHISHAGGMDDDDNSKEEIEEQSVGVERSFDPKAKQLSSIFVTESIPHAKCDSHLFQQHNRRRSNSNNIKRSSYSSSIYSSTTNSTKGDRIKSSSTMATTILDRFPTNSKNGLSSRSNNNSLKSNGYNKISNDTIRPVSEASQEDSIQFLKDYSFPTLLEDKLINDFDSHSMAMSFLDTPKEILTLMPQQLPPMHSPSLSIDSKVSSIIDTPLTQIKRRNSLPLAHSLSTPELENMLFKDNSPKSAKRVSLGDVIMYYNQSSTSTESPSTFASPDLH